MLHLLEVLPGAIVGLVIREVLRPPLRPMFERRPWPIPLGGCWAA